MDFFYVDKNFTLTAEQPNAKTKISISYRSPDEEALKNGQIPLDYIYSATFSCVENLRLQCNNTANGAKVFRLGHKTKTKFYNDPRFPLPLTNFDGSAEMNGLMSIPSTPFIPLADRIKPLLDRGVDSVKVCIINGIGTGLGDTVVGLTALRIFHEEISKHFKKIEIHLYQTSYNSNQQKRQILDQEHIVTTNNFLPLTLEQLYKHDLLIDLTSMVMRDNFDNQPMIDFYLESMAIDPKTVADDRKRNFIKIHEGIEQEFIPVFNGLRNTGNKVLLLHTKASVPLRTMPDDQISRLVGFLVDNTDVTIISMEDLGDLGRNLSSMYPQRFIALGHRNTDTDALISVIHNVDYIITVDTSIYHIADAFNKPTIALFTSIDPDLRVRYYPFVHGIKLDDKINKITGKHLSHSENDNLYARSLWPSLDLTQIPALLKQIEETPASAKHQCPVCQTHNDGRVSDAYLGYKLYMCSNCGCEYSDSRVPDDYDEKYTGEYNHYIHNSDPKMMVQGFMHQWRFESTKAFMEADTRKGQYLDIGCASGFLVKWAQDLGYDAWGVDIAQRAVDYANNTLGLGHKTAVNCDVSNLPSFFPQQYDLVTSFELVEHLPDPAKFASDVFKILKPGGVWIFSTPNRNRIQMVAGIKNMTKHWALSSGDGPPEHLTRFGEKAHQVLAQLAGFDVLYQNTSRVAGNAPMEIVGSFPDLVANVNGQRAKINAEELNNTMINYLQPFTNRLYGYGNFLTTFVRKPK